MRYFLFILIAAFACNTKQADETEEQASAETTEVKVGADAELKEGQRVYFVNIDDKAALSSPIKIEMGVEGMDIEPAGEPSLDKGHHHLLINDDSFEKGEVIPADSTHIHFGKGQTEAEISLPPGSYKLTLQFADGFHRSYGPQMSASVEVTVTE